MIPHVYFLEFWQSYKLTISTTVFVYLWISSKPCKQNLLESSVIQKVSTVSNHINVSNIIWNDYQDHSQTIIKIILKPLWKPLKTTIRTIYQNHYQNKYLFKHFLKIFPYCQLHHPTKKSAAWKYVNPNLFIKVFALYKGFYSCIQFIKPISL